MDNNDYVNHDETVPANNVLEPNNIIGAHIAKGNGDSFYDWIDTYDEWNGYYHTPTEENESGSSHTFTGDNNIFKTSADDKNIFIITKIKHNGTLKTRLVSETQRKTSKINMGRLKPMIKLFDSGWNYIPNIFTKLISLLVIWSYI